MKVDLVLCPANPKFKSVPLLSPPSESLETPLCNFYLLESMVFGVALLITPLVLLPSSSIFLSDLKGLGLNSFFFLPLD